MRALVQRVSKATVTVDGEITGAIGRGLLVLLGAGNGDTNLDIQYVAQKVVGLRIFEDEAGQMNRALLDVDGKLLVVSQFTLYGDCRKGRRPSFTRAMAPGDAEKFYLSFVDACRGLGAPVETGRFGAMMQVELCNDGPVTLLIDSDREARSWN